MFARVKSRQMVIFLPLLSGFSKNKVQACACMLYDTLKNKYLNREAKSYIIPLAALSAADFVVDNDGRCGRVCAVNVGLERYQRLALCV